MDNFLNKCLTFGAIACSLASCDPGGSGTQILKNSTSEDLIFERISLLDTMVIDSFKISKGLDTTVFSVSKLGPVSEIGCSKVFEAFNSLPDSVIIMTISGKKMKKIWSDDDNWESKHTGGTRFKMSTSQTCTFELTDDDF